MGANSLRLHTTLSPDACRRRVSTAESGSGISSLGRDLLSVVEVVDGGDCFELRHKVEPVIFRGNISPCESGCDIAGEMQVPAQGFYRFAFALAWFIGSTVVGATIYDLLTGAHLLHTRRFTELGIGHPASLDAHFFVLVAAPLILVFLFLFWYSRIRGVSEEVRRAFTETLQGLFAAVDSSAEES